jgi:hypothetical protein
MAQLCFSSGTYEMYNLQKDIPTFFWLVTFQNNFGFVKKTNAAFPKQHHTD